MKKIYLTASLLLLAVLSFAQKQDSTKRDSLILNIVVPPANNPNKYTPNLTLPSPHAATLGDYGNTPINLSSGLPSPGISLFDLKEGDIGLGVSASYQYKGFKPFESPSLLGRGWALNAGGVITRIIRAKPDERRPISSPSGNYGYANSENRTDLATYINNDGTIAGSGGGNSVSYTIPDGEPDMFIFNFMGMTGKFFFGEDGIIHVVSDRKIKIEYRVYQFPQTIPNTPNSNRHHLVEFTVTDENGTIYKFGDATPTVIYPIKNVEFSTSGSDFDCLSGDLNITSWFLAEVTDKNGRKINFNYTNDYMTSSGNFNYATRGRSVSSPVTRGQYNSSTQTYSHDNMWSCVGSLENFLTSVTGTNWKVSFLYSKTGNVSYLVQAVLNANTTPVKGIKKFTFDYTNLTNPDGLLLSTLTESSDDFMITKSHGFTYNDAANLNYNNLYGIDYQGFDNGAVTNTSLIADAPFNANRSYNFAKTLKGALTKIVYPTGGSTEFLYEQNEYGQIRESEFENSVLINKKPYGGIRVKTITDKDISGTVLSQRNISYDSFTNASKSSGVISSSIGLTKIISNGVFASSEPNAPSFPTLANGTIYFSEGLHTIAEIPIYYTNVTETLSDGANTKTAFTSHNDYNDYLGINFGRGNSQIGSPASYLLMRSLPKSIKHYQNSVLIKEKIIAYNLVDRHKARSLYISTITAGTIQTYDLMKTYYTYSGWLQKISETERLYDNASNFIETVSTNAYNNSTYLQVSSMTTQSSKGETLLMNYKYPYDFSTPLYLTMVGKNIIAPIIEETSFLNSTQTASKITDYATFGTLQMPQRIRTKVGSGTEITPITFDTYDTRGNLTKFTLRSGQTANMLYYGTTDLGKTDLLKSQTIGGGSTGTVLGRTMAYDYSPLVGLSLETDINGYSTTYLYDVFNRLISIKDNQNYLLKDLAYHYANQTAITGLGVSPTNTLNYIISRTAREAQTGTELDSDIDKTTTQLEYMDGLGRKIQSLVWKGSPNRFRDIISGTTQFDLNGRANKAILPTPSDDVKGEYKSNAQTLASAFYDGDTHPYAETVFEASPLNRPIKQFGAGQAWRVVGNEKFVTLQYLLAGNGIIKFSESNGTITGATNYANSTLVNQCALSERGFQTYELKDKQGRVTHKFQQLQAGFTFAITAYCYNDLNQLVAVISPEAYNKFGTGAGQVTSITTTDALFKELCFFYVYDGLGRLIEKHVPGAGWRYSVYNKQDLEVFFADESDLAKGYWQWRKVDALSREIQNGILNGIGSTSRATLQTAFDGFTGQNYETTGTSLLGYTNVSFPSTYAVADANVMETRYYDDYAWQTDSAYNFQSANAFHVQGLTKGMMTGTIRRNVETNTWQKMVMYYDYQGKLIQDFHLTNRGNLVRKDHQHRFNGELLKTRIEKKNGSTVLSSKIFSYDFDHLGRKAKFKHSLGGNEKTIAKYEYDQIGRLNQKLLIPLYKKLTIGGGPWFDPKTWDFGGIPNQNDDVSIEPGHTVTIATGTIANAANLTLKNGAKLLNYGRLNLGGLNGKINNLASIAEPGYIKSIQTLNYKYHIRGGLRGLNLDASNNLTNDLFSYRLDYEDDGTLFDGNIRTQYWKSNIDGKQRAFGYTYDGASRLKSALYASTQAGEDYALNNVDYDANGNITNLSRNGLKSNSTFGLIDNLNYSYNTTSNKILKVDDASSETASFRDVTGNDYDYWLDGSLKKDNNKDITQIDYNYLKLPKQITLTGGRWIKYEYDASGTKLKKTLSTGKVTDYEEDEIYEDGILYQTSHDEGRIVDGIYEYNITDHLGNNRISFRDFGGVAQITQVNHVGAYGEPLPSLNSVNTPKINNFTYSTYEKENDFGIGVFDAHARIFDPIAPHFWQIDPLSELSRRFSPTAYANNNPLRFIDPDGMISKGLIDDIWDKSDENTTWTNNGSGGFEGDNGSAVQAEGDKGKEEKSKNQISNYVNFNLNKLKNFASNFSNSLFEAKNTNLIIYGNGKASDNFFSGEFKKGGKTVVMDLGKDNQIFWLMSIYAPSRRFDDGGIPNLIDLFGDNHPIYSDKNFSKSGQYDGLFYEPSKLKYVGAANGYTRYDGNFYLPVSTYNQATTEYKYFLIGISQKQAESGIYKEILTKYK